MYKVKYRNIQMKQYMIQVAIIINYRLGPKFPQIPPWFDTLSYPIAISLIEKNIHIIKKH